MGEKLETTEAQLSQAKSHGAKLLQTVKTETEKRKAVESKSESQTQEISQLQVEIAANKGCIVDLEQQLAASIAATA